MKAAHGAGHYFCFSRRPSPPFSLLTGRGRCSWYQICPLRSRGAVTWALLLPRGMTVLPLLPRQRSGETLGPKSQRAMGTREGQRGGQGGQDGHRRLRNRDSGQKLPSASIPKVKLPSEGHTIFMNPYQHMASKKTMGGISGSLG